MSLNHSDVRASACIWPWLHEREKERVKPIVYRLPHFIVVCTLVWTSMASFLRRIAKNFLVLIVFSLSFQFAIAFSSFVIQFGAEFSESTLFTFVALKRIECGASCSYYDLLCCAAFNRKISSRKESTKLVLFRMYACVRRWWKRAGYRRTILSSFLSTFSPCSLPFCSRIRVSHKDYGRAFECAVCAVHV